MNKEQSMLLQRSQQLSVIGPRIKDESPAYKAACFTKTSETVGITTIDSKKRALTTVFYKL